MYHLMLISNSITNVGEKVIISKHHIINIIPTYKYSKKYLELFSSLISRAFKNCYWLFKKLSTKPHERIQNTIKALAN